MTSLPPLGKVLITAASVKSAPAALARLKHAGCTVALATTPSPCEEAWLIEQVRDVDAIVFAMEPVTSRVIDAASHLRIIARPGVGYDTVDIAAATRNGVVVTIAAGANEQSVADFTMGLLLAAARGIIPAAQCVQDKRWDRVIGSEVWNKTLTIIGLGRIGKAVAKRARGFDMRVLAVTRTQDEQFAKDHDVTYATLEEALRQADFVCLHAPLTQATENLVNERTIGLMKRSAYLINTSRGGLVDENALANAVRAGYLAGAAVDVLRAGRQQPKSAARRAWHRRHAAHGDVFARVDGAGRDVGREERGRRVERRATRSCGEPSGVRIAQGHLGRNDQTLIPDLARAPLPCCDHAAYRCGDDASAASRLPIMAMTGGAVRKSITRFVATILAIMLPLAILAGCGGGGGTSVADACSNLAGTPLPVSKAVIKTATLNAATSSLPEHCQVDGAINERTGVDGQPYAIKFRMRLPTDWNGRFYMGGGGGTNGTLVDPTSVLVLRYATIGTDSGHDNAIDNNPNAGGTGSFGADPQARIDFAFASYDQVTQIGKALALARYQRAPEFSYFQGCSEGGREALLMSQRFPAHYDGIVSGDPVLHIPLGPMAGIHTTKTFAGLATRMGLFQANGDPALNKTFTDPDLLLVRDAVLAACDSLDGLADGIVDNFPACTTALVHAKLTAVQCAGGKSASCLTGDQIASLEKAFEGPKDSLGNSLYASYPWDAGVSGLSGTAYNGSWRSWWLGSYNSSANNATKLNFVSAVAVIYGSPPVLPFASADSLNFSLNYNFDTDVAKMYTASGIYTPASTSMLFTDSTDYSGFRNRGGKLVIYQGVSDSSVSINDTITWYNKMNAAQGGNAQSFARLFAIPGMNHCSGGPATETFDALAAVVNWVEKGVAPDSIPATASNPGYFGVTSRSRPLCPYPKQTRYKGTGDINDASSFACQ